MKTMNQKKFINIAAIIVQIYQIIGSCQRKTPDLN